LSQPTDGATPDQDLSTDQCGFNRDPPAFEVRPGVSSISHRTNWIEDSIFRKKVEKSRDPIMALELTLAIAREFGNLAAKNK
jgi:hypothetical protein